MSNICFALSDEKSKSVHHFVATYTVRFSSHGLSEEEGIALGYPTAAHQTEKTFGHG
jgi:hypothetical protein